MRSTVFGKYNTISGQQLCLRSVTFSKSNKKQGRLGNVTLHCHLSIFINDCLNKSINGIVCVDKHLIMRERCLVCCQNIQIYLEESVSS